MDIAGVPLLDRFLRDGGESEKRLRDEGRAYADDAREGIAKRAGSAGAALLSALDSHFQ